MKWRASTRRACVAFPTHRSLERLTRGVIIDERRTAPAEVKLVRELHEGSYDIAVLEMTIREGRNRQIRRMCEAVGHPVFALRRIRIGPLSDPRLPSGGWRDLSPREVASLRRVAGSLAAAHEPVESPPPPRLERPSRPRSGQPASRTSQRGSERPRADRHATASVRARDARDSRGSHDSRDARDARQARASGLGKQTKHRRGANAVGKPAHKRKIR